VSHDPIATWRYDRRCEYDAELRLRHEAKWFVRAICVVGLLLAVTVIW
jgi:hypothetical protein